MNKLQAMIKEVEKYARTSDELIELQWEIVNVGGEINLETITSTNNLKLHDAYMDCKSNYPELFPTVSTQEVQEVVEEEKEEIEEVNWLLWDRSQISRSTYHADIKLPFNGVSDCYCLTIFKENNRWFIMGEDHDVTDYEENLDWDGKVVGFKTLWEAKEKAEDIREWMQECYEV